MVCILTIKTINIMDDDDVLSCFQRWNSSHTSSALLESLMA